MPRPSDKDETSMSSPSSVTSSEMRDGATPAFTTSSGRRSTLSARPSATSRASASAVSGPADPAEGCVARCRRSRSRDAPVGEKAASASRSAHVAQDPRLVDTSVTRHSSSGSMSTARRTSSSIDASPTRLPEPARRASSASTPTTCAELEKSKSLGAAAAAASATASWLLPCSVRASHCATDKASKRARPPRFSTNPGNGSAADANRDRQTDATGRRTPASRATPARSMRSGVVIDMEQTYWRTVIRSNSCY